MKKFIEKKKASKGQQIKELETTINVLESIQECLERTDVPADDFIQSWVRSNPNFPEAERFVRRVYAEAIGYAIGILKGR